MRIISKKISLEPYKSRINGSLEAYGDYGYNMGNYGTFPYDVVYNGMVLSYPTLMERYYFCKRYVEMLKYDACINEKYYDNAVTYYTHNFKNNIETLKSEYEDLDATFAEYGGKEFLNWCNSILYVGNVDYNEPTEQEEVEYGLENTAHILVTIVMKNTIDDMGEFSIFCNDWEEGIEYKDGDIAIYDDEVWLKKNTSTLNYGSIYSEKYKELYFPQIGSMTYDENYKWYKKSKELNKIEGSESQWVNYTDLKIKDSYGDLVEYDTYAVRNGKVYLNPEPRDLSYVYDITTNGELGFYVISNVIYKPFEYEYIEYVNNDNTIEYKFVYECDNFIQLNMKYCYIKGQKIYSKTKEDLTHYFTIDGKEYVVKPKEAFIECKGNAIKVNNGTVIANNITYPKIDGYTTIEGKIYYISNNKIVMFKRNDDGSVYNLVESLVTNIGKEITSDVSDNKTSGYTIEDSIICVFKPYNLYYTDRMSGYTESKLSSFATYNSVYDDMGNQLPRMLDIKS